MTSRLTPIPRLVPVSCGGGEIWGSENGRGQIVKRRQLWQRWPSGFGGGIRWRVAHLTREVADESQRNRAHGRVDDETTDDGRPVSAISRGRTFAASVTLVGQGTPAFLAHRMMSLLVELVEPPLPPKALFAIT